MSLLTTITYLRKLFHKDVVVLQASVREHAAMSLQRNREIPLKQLGRPRLWLMQLSRSKPKTASLLDGPLILGSGSVH
jgi:hypothetical protein